MKNMTETELYPYLKSILDMDRSAVVVCNLEHEIIYMNPAAEERYQKRGGARLLGRNLLDCHSSGSKERIRQVIAWFQESSSHNIIYTFRNEEENKDVYMVALRDGEKSLIGYYEKHEYRTPETDSLYHFRED